MTEHRSKVVPIGVPRRPSDPGKNEPRLMDRVRAALRTRHYSRATERVYVSWILRYIRFHGRRHPSHLHEADLSRYLTQLAVRRRVSASTQNQALGALLFLYREVLGHDVGWMDQLVRAKRPKRVPVVLTGS
nr:hypothetical protein [Gammaproteobacteria bacterium]